MSDALVVIFEGFCDKDKSAVPLIIVLVGSDNDAFLLLLLLLFSVEFLADVEGVVVNEDPDTREDAFVDTEVSDVALSFLWRGEGCLAEFSVEGNRLTSVDALRIGDVAGDCVGKL